jgi:Leucine-rich repeat (LRR) protein
MRSTKNRPNNKQILRTRYITPQDVDILPKNPPKAIQHYPIPIIQGQKPSSEETKTIPTITTTNGLKKNEIDGFYLLEASGISFPEDLQHLILSDRKLTSVVEDDLTYFTELLYLDVSENYLSLYSFGALPKLRELRLACNHITNLQELFGFHQLMYLDLSYNSIHFESLTYLCDLPILKELDLSGNQLKNLPTNFQHLEHLEKLILQYNKLDQTNIFHILGALPLLRSLDVSNNYFSSFPKTNFDDAFK